jgi:hypothetical protein
VFPKGVHYGVLTGWGMAVEEWGWMILKGKWKGIWIGWWSLEIPNFEVV